MAYPLLERLGAFSRLCLAGLVSLALVAQPAAAQSILRDAETEALFDEMARPLAIAAGLSPGNVRIVLIQSNDINAFVAGGQIVYLHSGLIEAADSANQVQGVIAHELGHVTGGHVIRVGEGYQAATTISLLSLVLGIAAMAAGAGEAGAGILAAGQQAALGSFLAYSRVQESSADAAGVSFLNKAGISGKGFIQFFKKLQNQEYRLAIPQDNSYNRTHPLSGERIARTTAVLEGAPAWSKPSDLAMEARFQRVKAKLSGFVKDPPETIRRYPESDGSVPALYARAYAYHRGAYPEKALAEADKLVRAAPGDPYFLELKGQILLESGKPREALGPLREATRVTRYQPLISTTFGHALIATEDPGNLAEAERVLRQAVARDGENPYAWYQLGTVYERRGDRPRAALATAERYNLQKQSRLALAHAGEAMAGIEKNSPDWIRAQDILLVSQAEVERDRKGRRGR